MTDLKRATTLALLFVLPLSGCGGDEPSSEAAAASPAAGSPAADYSAGGDDSADLAELADYELTMDDIRRWTALTHNPEFADFDAAPDDSGDDGDGSIDDMVAKISAHPRARSLIEDAGLDVRDFVLITFTVMVAGFAQYAIEQGADPDSVANATSVNPDNIRFMLEHGEELAALRNGTHVSGQ